MGGDAVHLGLRQRQLQHACEREVTRNSCTRHLVTQEIRVLLENLGESLRAADARGAQHGCNVPSRRRRRQTRARQQTYEVSNEDFVIEGNSCTGVHDEVAKGQPLQRRAWRW